MPRLGLSLNESFDSTTRAPKPDSYGRRVRAVTGVQITGERAENPLFTSLYIKATAALALLATLAVALAILRIYSFKH